MTGNKKKSKLSPRSKFSASPGPPSPAVSTVHASGESSLPASTSESNLHVHSSPAADDPPSSLSSPAAASSSVQPQSSETKLRGRNKNSSANDVERPTSRWFLRTGTWPRGGSKKSAPVTSIAQENVSGKSTSPAASIRHEQTTANTPVVIQEEVFQQSPAPMAAPSVMTKSAAPSVQEASRAPSPHPEPSGTESTEALEDTKDVKGGNNKDSDGNNIRVDDSVAPAAGSYWLGWWYGYGQPPVAEAPPAPKSEAPEEQVEETPVVEVVITREPTPPPPPPPPPPQEPEPIPAETSEVPALDGAADSKVNQRPRSWFGFWGGGPDAVVPNVEELGESSNPTIEPPPQEPGPSISPIATQSEPTSVIEAITNQSDTQLLGAQTNLSTPPFPMPSATETGSSVTSVAPTRSSGWAFWSRDRSKPTDPSNDSDASSTTTVGQLAVADTPSASNPQKAKVKDIPTAVSPLSPALANEPKVARSVSNLREESRPITPKKAEANTSTAAIVPITPQSAASTSSNTAKQTLKKVVPTNHVLPEFESCYHKIRQPSMFCQITRVFKGPIPHSKKHLYLTQTPPRIKKAVAIGVHGFFPMRLVRTVLGEPTGTSIRFANSAAAAIKRWAEKNNVEVEIEKIALEGEGKVGDRVEMLWKLLSNWMDHVRNADFVLMAAHSQGVVVGVQLLARLIEEGCVKEMARVGFTAMAGINLGPFYHLPTTILTGSAKELFEFQKPESTPSQKYMQALEVILKHNVRVLYVGSIDDQLVPLESSSFSNVTHPYIFRAVFVDGRVHAPDFLSHLVGFAMKLRNQGISDHGLIRELSNPLAGSLYGGEGHSRIYDDVQVYDLGVRHALETTDCEGVVMKVEPFELPTNTNNPFLLPWSMRGMLEESHVKDRLRGECMQLLEQFENWKPSSKVLKDVKFRLEGIRSKL